MLQRRESLADDRLFARLDRTLALIKPVKQCGCELLRFAPASLHAGVRERSTSVLPRNLIVDRFDDPVTQLVNPNRQVASAQALGGYPDMPLPASNFMVDAPAEEAACTGTTLTRQFPLAERCAYQSTDVIEPGAVVPQNLAH